MGKVSSFLMLPKSYILIAFKNPEMAVNARNELRKIEIDGKKLKIDVQL